jgi:hypothetical protein
MQKPGLRQTLLTRFFTSSKALIALSATIYLSPIERYLIAYLNIAFPYNQFPSKPSMTLTDTDGVCYPVIHIGSKFI